MQRVLMKGLTQWPLKDSAVMNKFVIFKIISQIDILSQ